PADEVFDVVLGSEVAKKLGYEVGTEIVITHGVSQMSFQKHADKPFRAVGILKATGTPVDRALYITLEGMEAIHMDWKDGAPPRPGEGTPVNQIKKENIKIGQITSFLLRTKNRIAILRLQREINDFQAEPLMSTIPGVALSKLWDTLSYAEIALRAISACVALVSILGLLLVLYTSLNERRREMSIFRALGLRPFKLLFLLLSESLTIVIVGTCAGALALYASLWLGGPWLVDTFGLVIPVKAPSLEEWGYLGLLVVASFFVGLIPAWTAYRRSLADGLGARI
ncbi:MAG: ABC transporter permease, partial [Bdellovibrionota bacterium]